METVQPLKTTTVEDQCSTADKLWFATAQEEVDRLLSFYIGYPSHRHLVNAKKRHLFW